ncbi:uncharacterized protein LOC132936056 [Metopolophium dirhodum]|uniref:uncharacterized protein LOC132936056 n=1 Tax=Metopolophium dirhodum TaxID=44670 RepID=UPI00298F4313|nr:uncharacterized protein LOC132936056 [Metopolophium dirhodum]
MESIGRSTIMGSNTNTAVSIANATSSAVVGLLLSQARPSVATITSNTKTIGLCHDGNHRMPLQHCANGSNIIQHHQYPPILVAPSPPTLVPPSLIHSTQTGSMLPAPPQLMLSTATVTTSGVIPQFQQHNGPHQLVTAATAPVSVASIVMPNSNVTTVGMALSPFGILPHERVVPHHTHHRHQHRKLPGPPPSKPIMDTSNTSAAQILTAPVINSQRFYIEPTHLSNKIKQYDVQPQPQHRIKIVNSISDKSLPVVSSAYVPQPYEQRYQPRTAPQQVGYLSVITRTAVPTTNGVMNDIAPNNNYYQAQPIPLQSKTSDNHERQYYHFDSTVSASQTPQQQLDNILLMGTPVQRGDPMHIVKNLQSMQTDIDCYGVKKMIDQQPRLLATDNGKTIAPTNMLGNGSKCIIEHQHQHLQQLPKSSAIDPSSSYNGQYFNRRQPPPAHLHQHHNQPHLQQHVVTGNTKMLPTPTSLTVVSANGNTYLDVQQHQRHHRWNLDHQKPPIVSTSSCFTGNISSGVFHQPPLHQHHHQQYNNTVQTFNVQPPPSNVHLQHQHISQPAHHNNFTVSSVNPTYYSPTTTMVSPIVTSVTTTSPSLSLYNRTQSNNQRQHTNIFQDFTNNLQGESYVVNDDNRTSSLPNVVVPNIEEELSHLCDDSITTTTTTDTTTTTRAKLLNITTQKPSFIDSYIKFINGGTSSATDKPEDECNDKSKKLLIPLASSSPKPISKPYVPLPKPKILPIAEQTSSRNGSGEDIKKINNVTTTTDDDPRYFPLPKTSSSIAGISEDRSDGSNGENSWLSADDEHDQWWISSSKAPSSTAATSVIKNKVNVISKKKKNNSTMKKKRTNSVIPTKKQKTHHVQQPTRQLSHRLAKEKTQQLLSRLNGELDLDDNDALSDTDSDVDPAWIPNNDDNDASKSSNSINSRHKKYSKERRSNIGHPPSTSSKINNNNNDNDHPDDSTLFKSGTFVALKRQFLDNGHVNPQHLWRVDGKSLLQKFTRCNEDNMYKSVSTYTGWSPSHYNMYRQVDVKIITTDNGDNVIPNKLSTIEVLVQLLSNNDNKPNQNNAIVKTVSSAYNHISKLKVDAINSSLSTNSSAFVDEQSVMLRANFDVYIQSLASQALDSNFLEEIYRENDEYFLSNLRAIETVTQTWKQTIDSTVFKDLATDLSNVENICSIIAKYPNMEICSIDGKSKNNINLRCLVCGYQEFMEKHQMEFVEISLSGMEYNSRTLKNIDSNITFSKIVPVKRFQCCSSTQCADKLTILHSLEHLKYYIYQECCKRVAAENENSCNGLTHDTTTVLNRLLADDEWIEKLFHLVCNTWAQAKIFISKSQSNCRAVSS